MTLNSVDDPWVARLQPDAPDREQAISELRDLLLRGLQRSLANRFGTGFQVEDVVQQALLKILDSLDRFEGRSQFTTWAMAIATRVGISEFRRKHYKDVSLDAMAAASGMKIELAESTEAPVENRMERRSVINTLEELIDQALTEKQRYAIRAALKGLPVEEIARRSGSNRNAIYKLVHDARLRLRDGLESAGIRAEDINAIFS